MPENLTASQLIPGAIQLFLLALGIAVLFAQKSGWRGVGESVKPWTAPVENFMLLTGVIAGVYLFLPLLLLKIFNLSLSDEVTFPLGGAMQAAILVAIFLLLPRLHPEFQFRAKTTPLHAPSWHPLLCFPASVALTFGASMLTLLLDLVFKEGLGLSLGLDQKQEAVLLIARNQDNWLFLGIAALSVAILAPLWEEIFFRGLLYPFLKKNLPPLQAMALTGIIFGTIHFSLAAFLPLALLGAYLCLVYEKTGDIRMPILVHALFNLNSLLLMIFVPDLASNL